MNNIQSEMAGQVGLLAGGLQSCVCMLNLSSHIPCPDLMGLPTDGSVMYLNVYSEIYLMISPDRTF